jgi:hypothetical protein
MKKTSILSVMIFALVVTYSESVAQTAARPKKDIIQSNKNFMDWFNSGQIDSITTLYADNACLDGRGCGKDFIKEHYKVETTQYKIQELITSEITVKDNTALETGRWKIQLPSGMSLSGTYRSEWQLLNKKWVIVKEASPTTDQ